MKDVPEKTNRLQAKARRCQLRELSIKNLDSLP